MTPGLSTVLMRAFGLLSGEVAPRLAGDYLQGSVATTGVLLLFAAQEAERGVAVLVAENAAFRALLADGAVRLTGDTPERADLKAALAAAGTGGEGALLLSALSAENGRLRGLLIRLHEAVETGAVEAGAAFEAQIWRVLAETAGRRVFQLPGA